MTDLLSAFDYICVYVCISVYSCMHVYDCLSDSVLIYLPVCIAGCLFACQPAYLAVCSLD